ncbi:hypothetical protein ABI59_20765 [Acidobacteria bacterium Mor1]|nr:hypothetical protein ABI59_20765 [Acidobacteria bacterium Mor1]
MRAVLLLGAVAALGAVLAFGLRWNLQRQVAQAIEHCGEGNVATLETHILSGPDITCQDPLEMPINQAAHR